ncbi:ParB/RepB/Spo0J family partition protein [bacterium]|nr:ParB/RepB/Spo0J family partition protein [bacterium]
MSKRRGLGKGLAELIPAAAPPLDSEVIRELEVGLIDPNPYQPRRNFNPEELAELAASIKSQGLLQPVTVRTTLNGRFQLIAGERRLRATRDLGQTTIRAIVREVDDRQLLELSLVENLLRTDLNDIEVAEALRELQNRFAYNTTQLAQVIGKSRPAVSNTLRLLELPDTVQGLVRDGRLTAGHARAVLSFPVDHQEAIAAQCVTESWSVRELESRAAEANQRKPMKRPRKKGGSIPSAPAALRRAESQLIEHLGTRVKISEQRGTGTIQVTYHGADDLQRILDILLKGVNPI